MIDVFFGLIAVAVAAVVILAWRRVHHEHQEVRARRAFQGEAKQPSRAVPARERAGWSVPQPLQVPRPTYWPAVLALGVVCMAWGAVSSLVLSLAGFGIFLLALTFWIREMLHADGTIESAGG